MAARVGVALAIPVGPGCRLGHRQVQQVLADARRMRFEASAQQTAGRQDHRLRVDPDRAEAVAQGEGRAIAVEAQRGDPLLGNQGHPPLRQHLLEQLAQADPRHRRRHGGNLEDFTAREALQFGPHVVRAVHAEHGRKADDPGRSGNAVQCRGQLFPRCRNLQRPGHDLGINLAAVHARKSDALRGELRPALPQIGHHLGAAESLQAAEIDDHAGCLGGQGTRPGRHGGRHAERLLQGAHRGQRRDVAGPRRTVGQPAFAEKGREFGEGLPHVAGGNPAERMLRLDFAQALQRLPGIADDAWRAVELADQIEVARGVGHRPGVADLRGGDLPVDCKDRRGKAGDARADDRQLRREMPRRTAHWSTLPPTPCPRQGVTVVRRCAAPSVDLRPFGRPCGSLIRRPPASPDRAARSAGLPQVPSGPPAVPRRRCAGP